MSIDRFALAVAAADGWESSDEEPPAGAIVSDPGSVANAGEAMSLTPQRGTCRPCASTTKEPVDKKRKVITKKPIKKVITREAHKTSQLTLMALSDNPTENKLHIIRLQRQEKKEDDTAKRLVAKKRSQVTEASPVVIWPQYSLQGFSGCWVIVNARSEEWLQKMLQVLKLPIDKNKKITKADKSQGADLMRDLTKNCVLAVKVMLRKALESKQKPMKATNEGDEEDATALVSSLRDSDDEDATTSNKLRLVSGWHFEQFPVFKVHCGGMPVTILNDGRQMILQLDDDGVRFIQHGMKELIEKLTMRASDPSTSPVKIDDLETACFKFDDSTPNIFEKVIWDPDRRSWKVTYKSNGKKTITYQDRSGISLGVSDELSEEAFESKKADLYTTAIQTWNDLDKSSRKKITVPLVGIALDRNELASHAQGLSSDVDLISPSKGSSSDANELFDDMSCPLGDSALVPMTLADKWSEAW